MNYCVIDSKNGSAVDFDFKAADEAKKAVFRSREDAFYFLDCFLRENAGGKSDEEAIKEGRARFTVQELA